ncbi:MAG: hypothetical protein U0361_04775 [Nitrospiraceae bacterium]
MTRKKYAAKILRIQHLEQVSDVLNSALTEDDKLRRAVDAAVRLLKPSTAPCFLPVATALQLRGGGRAWAESIKGLESPTAAGVVKSGQGDPRQGRNPRQPAARRLRVAENRAGSNLVSVPVRAGQEMVGVVEVVNKRSGKPFSNWDLLELPPACRTNSAWRSRICD